MSKHNETGLKGEQEAVKFLAGKGYTILHKNWGFEKKEIDIIAQKDDCLVFVEVKTRHDYEHGFPEEFVNKRKQGHIKNAALEYLHRFPSSLQLQFDVIAILMQNQAVREIVHFEDAFY